MTVGTPPQNISFMPHDYLNDTWIYNSTDGFCTVGDGGGSQDFCVTYRGGLYDVQASSTFKTAANVYSTGGDPSDAQPTVGTHIWYSAWANDVLSLGNIALPDFPLGMPGFDFGGPYDTQNNIGLGINSTILSALVAAGKIASRSYSWWWGQTGATDGVQMDGAIVFGGYDTAKASGDRYTQKLEGPTLNCPSGMAVTITDVKLNFPNGTMSSILQPAQISGCLQPDFSVIMTLLQTPYYDNFEAYTQTQNVGRGGGNGIDTGGMLYAAGEAYTGGITIVLNNNFSVEIPNDLLVVPPQNIASDGTIFTNTSVAEVLIGPTSGVNSDNFAIIGRYFFSSAYLSVDYDAGTFTLWQANPTTDTNLVPLGGNCSTPQVNTPANNATANNATGSSSSNGTHGSAANNTGKHSPGLSTGAIAGVAVGAALGAAALAAVAVICYMRKRAKDRRATDKQEPDTSIAPQHQAPVYYDHQGPRYNEATTDSEVLELRADHDPRELTSEPARLRYKRYAEANNSPVELG